ncbi:MULTISPECIES: glycosyl hydrolase family 28-related protein [unclassified Blastococcus]
MDDGPHTADEADGPDAGGEPHAEEVTRRAVLAVSGGLAAVPVLDWLTPDRAAAAGTLYARDFGATGNGTSDDTAAIQRLVDASARQAAVGVLPAGTYRCTRSLLLPPGAQLQLASGARLLKDWAAAPGLANAFLRNADFAVRSSGVRITGPGTIGARDHSRTGVVIALYGDDVLLRDLTIDTYAGGQAVMYAGDRGRMDRVRIRNSRAETGTGGIRVLGGADFLATACDVQSGDDCLQFVPIGDPAALLFDMSITRGTFSGCTGTSTVSRFMVALLEWTRGDGGMSASVTDCAFTSCRGAGTDRGIVVKNTHSSGAIARLRFTDCAVDMARAANAGTQEIRIQTDPASGGTIRDVTFTRTDVTRPVNSVLRIGGPNISGVTFDSCTFPAPSGTADAVAVVDQADRVRMVRSSFAGAPGKRLLVAGPIAPATAFAVESCRFTGIPNAAWGVDLVGAPGARVAGSTFQRATGTTTARAVRVSAASPGVVIEGNDLTGLNSSPKITDNAADTVVRANQGA